MRLTSPSPHVAIVTGHSRGLGAALAATLLDRGIPVLGLSRTDNADLGKRFPRLIQQVRIDLSDTPTLARWIYETTLETFARRGTLPMLVNNAGLLQPIGPLELQDVAGVGRTVAVNVGAALMLSAAFVAATQHAPDRRILHISSGAGRKAYSGWSVYCATKAALDHHARSVVLDASPGLRICSLAPGVIDTDMQAEIRATTDERFRERQRFVQMKVEGQLHSAAERGRSVADLLVSPGFGDEPIMELPR
jgi:benzil reductase ((S)-benzoin forming)